MSETENVLDVIKHGDRVYWGGSCDYFGSLRAEAWSRESDRVYGYAPGVGYSSVGATTVHVVERVTADGALQEVWRKPSISRSDTAHIPMHAVVRCDRFGEEGLVAVVVAIEFTHMVVRFLHDGSLATEHAERVKFVHPTRAMCTTTVTDVEERS